MISSRPPLFKFRETVCFYLTISLKPRKKSIKMQKKTITMKKIINQGEPATVQKSYN